MPNETLRQRLDDYDIATAWLRDLGVADTRRAHASLRRMAMSGVTLDLLGIMCEQLREHLPTCPDPDMALHNLERFVATGRNPLAVGTFFERDTGALPILLQIFSCSQHFSDLIVADPEGFDVVRRTAGSPMFRRQLVEELVTEVEALDHDAMVLQTLRRFHRRETLRIAYGDIIRDQTIPAVTSHISHLADAILEAALRAARRKVEKKRGVPRDAEGRSARFVVLGMGKLGGRELNYSSDIDLIFLYDGEGKTDGQRSTTNQEFFEQVGRELVRMLTEVTELGYTYRVDLRLRPEGSRGPMVPSVQSALHYYDLRGRTWERQAYIKARAVAGDLRLGRDFLAQLAPWIYRRYLSRADISGIKALKRRIEQQTHTAGADHRNVKTGHGGIRDIEFVIQFLQLLNGGDLSRLRTGNTLEAIDRLAQVGCLSDLERTLLSDHYAFLRKIEHRLQIMFDLQTHMLPEQRDEIRKLALRMGYEESSQRGVLEAFEEDYDTKTQLNRQILDHLLHDAFSDDKQAEAEVDLVLDPAPPEERIDEVLGRYPFRDIKQAYRSLMALSEEKIRFLSTRRCRHFLAGIAPELLKAIAATADPDSTLVNLDKVSDSLGGKGVLWELFSFNPPSLRLYVELCAYSPYLSEILTGNPGMLDSLMDSLVVDQLPSRETLAKILDGLTRAAEDLAPILHSFKNDQQLRVGVRDILGKDDVQTCTAFLADLAETCLTKIIRGEYEELVKRFGQPTIAAGSRAGKPCELVILAMGKFGGQELNYHSDLDLVFLYEADGSTASVGAGLTPADQATSNPHFFSELAQKIIKKTTLPGAFGRLYEIDARLRPTGRSGALATSFEEFSRYFAEGDGQLWERQALCKARVVHGSPRAARSAMSRVGKAAFAHRWRRENADEILKMRQRLEETATSGDLKRGPGGIVDVEFLVQMFQLRYGRSNKAVRHANTLAALAMLRDEKILSDEDYRLFDGGYRFLRTIESRLRLMNLTSRDTLPDTPMELAKLAHLLRHGSGEDLQREFKGTTQRIRQRFSDLFNEQGAR